MYKQSPSPVTQAHIWIKVSNLRICYYLSQNVCASLCSCRTLRALDLWQAARACVRCSDSASRPTVHGRCSNMRSPPASPCATRPLSLPPPHNSAPWEVQKVASDVPRFLTDSYLLIHFIFHLHSDSLLGHLFTATCAFAIRDISAHCAPFTSRALESLENF